MIPYLFCNQSNKAGVTCGARTSYQHPSEHSIVHSWVLVGVMLFILFLVFCVVFWGSLFVLCSFYFDCCAVCTLIYSFWLSLWYIFKLVLGQGELLPVSQHYKTTICFLYFRKILSLKRKSYLPLSHSLHHFRKIIML